MQRACQRAGFSGAAGGAPPWPIVRSARLPRMLAPMKKARAAKRGVSWADVRRLVLSLPGVAEGTSYGMPAFLLDGKFFSRFNEKEDGLVVHADVALRDTLLASRPDVYFTTDHYRGYPYVLVRLARIPRAELAALLENAFRAKAKKGRIAQYDAGPSAAPRPRSSGTRARRGS